MTIHDLIPPSQGIFSCSSSSRAAAHRFEERQCASGNDERSSLMMSPALYTTKGEKASAVWVYVNKKRKEKRYNQAPTRQLCRPSSFAPFPDHFRPIEISVSSYRRVKLLLLLLLLLLESLIQEYYNYKRVR
jgi:hypothetical protein